MCPFRQREIVADLEALLIVSISLRLLVTSRLERRHLPRSVRAWHRDNDERLSDIRLNRRHNGETRGRQLVVRTAGEAGIHVRDDRILLGHLSPSNGREGKARIRTRRTICRRRRTRTRECQTVGTTVVLSQHESAVPPR